MFFTAQSVFDIDIMRMVTDCIFGFLDLIVRDGGGLGIPSSRDDPDNGRCPTPGQFLPKCVGPERHLHEMRSTCMTRVLSVTVSMPVLLLLPHPVSRTPLSVNISYHASPMLSFSSRGVERRSVHSRTCGRRGRRARCLRRCSRSIRISVTSSYAYCHCRLAVRRVSIQCRRRLLLHGEIAQYLPTPAAVHSVNPFHSECCSTSKSRGD